MINHYLSSDSNANSDNTTFEFNVRRKIASACNRLTFLKKCINENVLPRSAPPHLRHDFLPFTESARVYLEEGCDKLREEITLKKENMTGTQLSPDQIGKLKNFNELQRRKLDR